MTLHASSWGSYELDDSWTDDTAHVLRRAGADGSIETLVVHRDPGGAGSTAMEYAEKQKLLLASLPGFVLQHSLPCQLGGIEAHELAFAWTTPNGPIEQVQIQVPGPDGMVMFTSTGAPRLTPGGRDALKRALLSALIPPTPSTLDRYAPGSETR